MTGVRLAVPKPNRSSKNPCAATGLVGPTIATSKINHARID